MRFSVLASCLALTVLLNFGAYSMGGTPLIVVVVLAAVVAVAFPSPATLGTMYLAYCVQYLVDDRSPLVHTHFQLVIGLAVLSTLALTWSGSAEGRRARFVQAFAPVGLSIAGVSFFAAGFAKLNTAFVDPDLSCATVFYEWSRTIYPYRLLPTGDPVIYGVVGLTWVCELLGPLLLIPRRTRRVGFLLIALLGFLLGTNPQARYYEFTSPFLALGLLAFDPEPVWDRFRRTRLGAWVADHQHTIAWGVLGVLGAAVVLAMLTKGHRFARIVRLDITRGTFVVWVLAIVLPLAFLGPVAQRAPRPPRPLPGALAWLAVLFVVVQETTPYLGIRAYGSFAMAANLQLTRDYGNHLLVEVPRLSLNRMAVLQRSSADELDVDGKLMWPEWALFDYVARHPDDWVEATIGGQILRLRAGSDPRVRRSLFATLFPPLRVPVRPFVAQCGHVLPIDSPYRAD